MVICKVSIPYLRRLACRLCWSLLLGLVIPVQAENAVKPDPVPQAQATLDRLQAEIAIANAETAQQLKAFKREIAKVRSGALDCIQAAQPKIELLDSQLAILQPTKPQTAQAKKAAGNQAVGQPQAPMSPAISRQLQELQQRRASLEGRIDSCKLMLLSSNEMDATVDENLRGLEARRLLERGPTVLEVLRANIAERKSWLDFSRQLALTATGWQSIGPTHLALAAGVGLLGFILGRVVPRRLRASMATASIKQEKVSAGLAQATISSIVSYAPILAGLGGMLAYVMLVPSVADGPPFVASMLWGLLVFFALAAGIRTLLRPCPPATPYLGLAETIAIPLSRRSMVLAMIVPLRWLAEQLHADGSLNDTMYILVRHVISLVWVLNVIWIALLLRRLGRWQDKGTLLLLLGLGLFAGLVAAWIGYLNLGSLVISGITYTLLLVGLTLVLSQFFSDLFDGLDEGRYHWQVAVRHSIGLKDTEYVPGLGWLRLLVNLALWVGAALLVLRVWDAGEELTGNIVRYFTEGFQVAGLTIVPTQLFMAILVFAISLTLAGWLKDRLNKRWLVKTRMEPSAREALVTTFGYVAVAIAVIVALSVAGIKFANLAIIAGALSVGIGFGLQNIVNNFVSGIIMLVERPVRNGDWVVVGNTEGYVQRISIRTTTIQTLDRADVIVPNSDLISGQVTNWTLGNTWGRIKIPIGVAYGSDIEMVIATLLEVANNNADVIKDMSVIRKADAAEGDPDLAYPSVLFLDFGDSSLDFELRVIIRDINQRRYVTSDLNRAINAAFIDKGIDIPFPQRDVNLRGPAQVEPAPGATGAEAGQGQS
jgi:small-conductance mechanosensitive channel